MTDFKTRLTASGKLRKVRQQQTMDQLYQQAGEKALHLLSTRIDFSRYFRQTLQAVKNSDLSPRTGLRHISKFIQHHYFQ